MTDVPLTRIQKIIAKRMLQSKQQQPCFYLKVRVDITNLDQFRKRDCRKAGIRASTQDLYFTAAARAIKQFPLMAGQIKGDSIKISDTVNVGFAVDTAGGLLVPVLRGVEKLSLTEIADNNKLLVKKARANKLTLDELTGANISISALGLFGVSDFIAIVPPGEASILATGKPFEMVVKTEDGFSSRKMQDCWLAVDHRVVNGVYAAKFLKHIANLLENPHSLL